LRPLPHPRDPCTTSQSQQAFLWQLRPTSTSWYSTRSGPWACSSTISALAILTASIATFPSSLALDSSTISLVRVPLPQLDFPFFSWPCVWSILLQRWGEAARLLRRTSPHVEYASLHLTATALFAQAQAQCPPSLYLLQAGLLLALYEYLSGRPDKAFTSIACCARMAYAARMHVCNQPSPQPPWRPIDNAPTALAYKLQVQEAANTWWGIIISER
jgi:hypothetical protein